MELDLLIIGRHYSFNNLPPIFDEFEYFIVIGNDSLTDSIIFIFFNKNVNVTKVNNSINIITDDNASGGYIFYIAMNKVFKTEAVKYDSSYTYGSGYRLLGCSENLIEDYGVDRDSLRSIFLTNEFYFEAPVVVSTVLSPIVAKQENIPQSIFHEMFSVLPILLVILVGFIGIRKAISWLFNLLKHS